MKNNSNIITYIYEHLSDTSIERFKKASEPRKIWLIEYVRTGSIIEAAKIAYPTEKESGYRQMAYKNRKYFEVSILDLYRAIGINEVKIGQKILKLLEGKKETIYMNNEKTIEKTVIQDDLNALKKGVELAINILSKDKNSIFISEKLKNIEDFFNN